MMLYPPINDLIQIAGNRYSLVHMVAKKAREMACKQEDYISDKYVTLAIQKIMQDAQGKGTTD